MRGPKNEKRPVSASLEKLEENEIESDLKKSTEHVTSWAEQGHTRDFLFIRISDEFPL